MQSNSSTESLQDTSITIIQNASKEESNDSSSLDRCGMLLARIAARSRSDQYSYCTHCQAPLTTPLELKRESKHKPLTDARQGALVGAFVGLTRLIVVAIYAVFIILPFVFSAFTASMTESPKALAVFSIIRNILIVVAVVFVPIISVIMGAVLGVLFFALRQRLPGSTIIRSLWHSL